MGGEFNSLYYNNFACNPNIKEITEAVKIIQNRGKYDVIIAVGGGSVIDFAKAWRLFSKSDLKLIAIPTTFGTGSESTQFAVLYKDGKKMSLDEKSILPEYAVIDSNFALNSPQYLKACTAMDAFCQAIESFWAVNSTTESMDFAIKSISLCRDNIIEFVNTNNETAAENMALASNLAGKAINISRTTASHALSYSITTKYGIPHGHAVALSIKNLYQANSQVSDFDLLDIRGIDYVKQKFITLNNLLINENYFDTLFDKIHLETNISKLGISDINYIANNVNIDRLSNNPRKLDKNLLYSLFNS